MSLQRKTLAEMLTFTRAGTATYFGSDGLLKTAAANEARFDYDPVTLQPRGLLVEGSRTNVLLRSEEFNDAAWGKVAGSVTANATTAPTGAATADQFIEDTSTGQHDVRVSPSFVSGTTYTFSVFAKANGRRMFMLFPINTAGHGATFDLVSGTVSGVFPSITAAIVPVGSGWYRCSVTATASATAPATIRFVTDNGTTNSFTGDGVSGFYLFGAQLTAGAFTTSYIPTTAAAATRAADVVTMTGARFSDWFNSSEGTFAVDFSTITNGLGDTGGAEFEFVYDVDNSGALTSGHTLVTSSAYGPGIRAITQISGASQAELTSAVALGTGATIRHAYAYKANDFASSLNGGTVQTDAAGTLPAPNQMTIGSQNAGGSSHFDGHIRRIRYWPNRLSNALLQEATA